MIDEITKEDLEIALDNINTAVNEKVIDINEQLNSIDSNVSNINDNLETLLVIKEPVENKDEQKTETSIAEKKSTETKSGETGETTEETEAVTLTDIYDSVEKVNENITLTNQILTGNILFLGVIVGVLLFKIMWDRFKK